MVRLHRLEYTQYGGQVCHRQSSCFLLTTREVLYPDGLPEKDLARGPANYDRKSPKDSR